MSSELTAANPLQTGLIIGIPFCGRLCMPEWATALATLRMPPGLVVQYSTARGMEVGDARNQIAEHALKVGAKYLLFIDDDTQIPPYAILKLMYALDQQAPPFGKAMVCAGIYCAKADPATPIVYSDRGSGPFWDWKFDDIFECASIGTGCMLIKTEVFTKIERPWFKTITAPMKAQLNRLEMGVEKIHEDISVTLTDDIYFCYKVADAGYKILAHGGVLCPHWDVTTQKEYKLADDSYPMIPREEKVETKPWNAFAVCEPKKSEVL